MSSNKVFTHRNFHSQLLLVKPLRVTRQILSVTINSPLAQLSTHDKLLLDKTFGYRYFHSTNIFSSRNHNFSLTENSAQQIFSVVQITSWHQTKSQLVQIFLVAQTTSCHSQKSSIRQISSVTKTSICRNFPSDKYLQ